MLRRGIRKSRWKLLLVFAVMICMPVLAGCGKGTDSIYDFSSTEPKDIDPWTYIKDTALSSNQQILSFASSASRLAIVLGVMGIVFSIFCMALRILFSNSAKTKNDIKEEAITKGLVAIMIFSVPLWLGICKLIGELLI